MPIILTKSTSLHDLPLTIDNVSLLPYQGTDPETSYALADRRQASIRSHLIQLLTRHRDDGNPIACVVYDSIMPWALDIAKEFGVLGAAFFTQSCAVNAIYYNFHKGWLSDVSLKQSSISLDGLPILHPSDLPSFVYEQHKYPTILAFLSNQYVALKDAHWIFVNTFDSLEPKEVKWMEGQFPFKNIGPMVPSIYLDGRLQNDKDYGISLLESSTDCTMKWLHSKGQRSVIYVSFGSAAELGKEQMEELACGLTQTNKFFLWVVRESEIHKLPYNFIEDTAEKGLVVNWCSQLQVLAHKSVGCFVTHCGWNSTLEALSLGVPLVTMPQWTDQPTNAKYVEDVWRIGKRARKDEDGICRREEIEFCVNEVMEGGEVSEEIRENVRKWRELAKAALDEGGSSHTNINHFVQQLSRKT
ncbi:unnamed protein product [Citrullus colocynthis]|uniref:Glycosyltransferase n=1 Tax=Citrullus colocynthis TaxID=252529 RepID=A0ABP0XMC2_9ROSI